MIAGQLKHVLVRSQMEKHRSHLDAMYLYFFRMRFLSSVLGNF